MTLVSSRALADRDRCERLFALQYGERLYWPGPVREAGPAARLGEAFHRAVQRHRLGLEVRPAAELADHWARFLASPYAEPAGPDLVPPGVRIWTEETLQAAIQGVPFFARLDEIRREGGRWTILDWKTGSLREDPARSWQTRLYRFLLARAGRALLPGHDPCEGPDRITLVYWLVGPGQALEFPYSVDEYRHDAAHFREVALAARKPFAALPGPQDPEFCRECRFDSYCHPLPAPTPPRPAVPRFEI